MTAWLIRLAGVTAHFRDPRINTAKIGLPARTLRCPPPCTIHGLLCAAKGGWVDPEGLRLGWRTDYVDVGIDFQTSRLPQRKAYGWTLGIQRTDTSPVEREILTFPILTLLALEGVDADWFRRPANPLSLGRSEDLITEHEHQSVEIEMLPSAEVARQCLPLGVGAGTIYAAPMFFEGNRRPVSMAPRTDAVQMQRARAAEQDEFARVASTGEAFYVWNFASAAG